MSCIVVMNTPVGVAGLIVIEAVVAALGDRVVDAGNAVVGAASARPPMARIIHRINIT
jgi:hypothetical protein